MRIAFSKSGFLIATAVLLIFSCKSGKNKYPEQPILELTGVKVVNSGFVKDSSVYLYLHFTDGDGDIGLDPQDTMLPFGYGQEYFYNLKVWMFERKNGLWQRPINPLTLDTLDFHERIRNLTPSGKQKWVVGDLKLNIPAEPYSLKPDSVFFRVALIDRKLHISNAVETGLIVLKH